MRLFRKKTGRKTISHAEPARPRTAKSEVYSQDDQEIEPSQATAFVQLCLAEIKARGLKIPFVFLPFRPDCSAASLDSLIKGLLSDGVGHDSVSRELMLMHPLEVMCAIRWIYSRIRGGLLSSAQYELFCKCERQMNYDATRYKTILSALFEEDAKLMLFYSLLDLLISISANEKHNGHSPLKLARLSAIFIFSGSFRDTPDFREAYSAWKGAALASQHLFLGYLRALSAEKLSGISPVPLSLQALINAENYPPTQSLPYQMKKALKLKLLVESLSPSPLLLLGRAVAHSHRIDNPALQSLSAACGQVSGLESECARVIKSIEAVNSQQIGRMANDMADAAWMSFEENGFRSADHTAKQLIISRNRISTVAEDTSVRRKKPRPKTPDWSQFMSSGFDEKQGMNVPDILPMYLHLPSVADEEHRSTKDPVELLPGTLAEVNRVGVDDALWEAWIISLAGEMSNKSKGTFHRCVILQPEDVDEWLIVEEVVKPQSPSLISLPSPRKRSLVSKLGILKKRSKDTVKDKSECSIPSREQTAEYSATELRIQSLLLRQAKLDLPATTVRRLPVEKIDTTDSGSMATYQEINDQLACSPLQFDAEAKTAMTWTSKYDMIESAQQHETQAEADPDPKQSGTVYPLDGSLRVSYICASSQKTQESDCNYASSLLAAYDSDGQQCNRASRSYPEPQLLSPPGNDVRVLVKLGVLQRLQSIGRKRRPRVRLTDHLRSTPEQAVFHLSTGSPTRSEVKSSSTASASDYSMAPIDSKDEEVPYRQSIQQILETTESVSADFQSPHNSNAHDSLYAEGESSLWVQRHGRSTDSLPVAVTAKEPEEAACLTTSNSNSISSCGNPDAGQAHSAHRKSALSSYTTQSLSRNTSVSKNDIDPEDLHLPLTKFRSTLIADQMQILDGIESRQHSSLPRRSPLRRPVPLQIVPQEIQPHGRSSTNEAPESTTEFAVPGVRYSGRYPTVQRQLHFPKPIRKRPTIKAPTEANLTPPIITETTRDRWQRLRELAKSSRDAQLTKRESQMGVEDDDRASLASHLRRA